MIWSNFFMVLSRWNKYSDLMKKFSVKCALMLGSVSYRDFSLYLLTKWASLLTGYLSAFCAKNLFSVWLSPIFVKWLRWSAFVIWWIKGSQSSLSSGFFLGVLLVGKWSGSRKSKKVWGKGNFHLYIVHAGLRSRRCNRYIGGKRENFVSRIQVY